MYTNWLEQKRLKNVCPTPLPENKKNQSCSELSETNFGIGFASIRENFFDPREFCSDSQKLRNFRLSNGTDFWRLSSLVDECFAE